MKEHQWSYGDHKPVPGNLKFRICLQCGAMSRTNISGAWQTPYMSSGRRITEDCDESVVREVLES